MLLGNWRPPVQPDNVTMAPPSIAASSRMLRRIGWNGLRRRHQSSGTSSATVTAGKVTVAPERGYDDWTGGMAAPWGPHGPPRPDRDASPSGCAQPRLRIQGNAHRLAAGVDERNLDAAQRLPGEGRELAHDARRVGSLPHDEHARVRLPPAASALLICSVRVTSPVDASTGPSVGISP